MIITQTTARFNILSCFAYGAGTLTLSAPIITIFDETAPLSFSKEWLILLFIFLAVGIFSLRMILWFVFGRETVLIQNNHLIIQKKGSFLIRRERKIPLESIKTIVPFGNFHERNSPSRTVGHSSRQMYIFRIQNVGRVRVQTQSGKVYRFLDNISLKVADEIVAKIRKEIS